MLRHLAAVFDGTPGMETPTSKHQAPEKLQTPSSREAPNTKLQRSSKHQAPEKLQTPSSREAPNTKLQRAVPPRANQFRRLALSGWETNGWFRSFSGNSIRERDSPAGKTASAISRAFMAA